MILGMYYFGLKRMAAADRMRIANGLLRLRDGMADVPHRSEANILLATWNIREFDSPKFGVRLDDAIYYIAEILSHFDLVAVQEVRESLEALERVMRLLGRDWDYIVTDVTEGKSGNGERMAFLYDNRRVAFTGLAGEIVIKPEDIEGGKMQFARTPYLCSFQSGWTKLNLCTIHAYYGTAKADDPRRIEELKSLTGFLADRIERESSLKVSAVSSANWILLGDFNIFQEQGDKAFEALNSNGFQVHEKLQALAGRGLGKEKHFYDQIAVHHQENRFEITSAGFVDWSKSVFRDRSVETDYSSQKDYDTWRTYQMSDHFVLWTEIRTDFGKEYLTSIAT